MSGLVALFHRGGRPADEIGVAAMLDAAPYRSPDGRWVRAFGSVALGYAKMAVTPEEESEQQPLVSPRTGCAVIADARLDNRDELLAGLRGCLPRTASDAELILHAYEQWELDAPVRLLGDFAFVVWDPRHERLVGARDTSGQRSLFYRVDSRTFAAASEIHQLLQDPTVPVAPNEERIRDFLVPLNMFRNEKDQAATFFEGIYAVPAGHVLVVDRAVVSVRRYWEFEPPAELRYRTDDEYAEHYRSLFFDVVRDRLRSSRPIGVLLSGGLDSSSVACTVQDLYRAGRAEDHGFTSFSFVFDGLECDERGYIEDIQAKYGFNVQFIPCGKFAGRLQAEPRGFMEAPNMGIAEGRDAVFGAANQIGVRALLTGDLADGCVGGGWQIFDSLLRQGHLRAFWQHFQTYRRLSNESLRKIVAMHCLGPLLPLSLQQHLTAAYIRRVVERDRPYLLPTWMPEHLREVLVQLHLRYALEAERGRRFANPVREHERRLLYPPEVARHPVPWPIEIWRPFADRRLHEFLLAIPPEQKFWPHEDAGNFYAGSKRVVRRAMRGILPESIRTRTAKTVFTGVLASELERQWPEYEAVFGPHGRPEVARRGYVDQQRFWTRLCQLRSAMEGGDMIYTMQVVGLETWLRSLNLSRPQLVTVPPAWGTQFRLTRRAHPATLAGGA